MPTFSEFVRQEYLPYAYRTKRSAINDDSKFRLHLEPKFGHLRLCDITTRDVQMHHASIKESHSPGTANRHLALLSATFRKAMEWDKLNRNPAAGIKAFKENNQRQRFLSPDEIGRLFGAMEQEKNKVAVAALKLLMDGLIVSPWSVESTIKSCRLGKRRSQKRKLLCFLLISLISAVHGFSAWHCCY